MSGVLFFFSSRRRHTIGPRDWSSDVCSSDLSASPNAPSGWMPQPISVAPAARSAERSEERRVGKECRYRWSPDHKKKKMKDEKNKETKKAGKKYQKHENQQNKVD